MNQGRGDSIAGAWTRPAQGVVLRSVNPARPDEVVYEGLASRDHVDAAVAAARQAFSAWSSWDVARREQVLRRFADLCRERVEAMAALIRDEVGKPSWDARAEAELLASKVDITLDQGEASPRRRVQSYDVVLGATRSGRCEFRPHGVMAVLGPFNFPAHLPNGHIVPALLMGNTVVFKPSDKAPAVGELLSSLMVEALQAEGAPSGTFNMVQGGVEVASALVKHDELDGILFTGSWPVGRRIMEANLDRPGRLLALEMGGNSAAVIMPSADLALAVQECVRCAFITAGQRCTATRRVIVHKDVASKVIPALARGASSLSIGDPASSRPVFLGPVISDAARDGIIGQVATLVRGGGELLVEPAIPDGLRGFFLSPGLMRVDGFEAHERVSNDRRGVTMAGGSDVEVFGPFVRVAVVESFEAALAQANATRFGLVASLFSRDEREIEGFFRHARAGCLNVNTGTAGASSKLPFGGLGLSGNHRPAGAFSLDYSAYPVACMVERGAATNAPGLHVDPGWVR